MAKTQAATTRQIIIRRYQRVNYDVPVTTNLGDHVLNGTSSNISQGGMEVTVVLPEHLNASDLMRMECIVAFRLPHFPSDLRMGGRIVWMRGKGPVTLGIQYLHGMPRVAVFILQELIRKQLMM